MKTEYIDYGNKTWVYQERTGGPELIGTLDENEEIIPAEFGDEIEFQEAYDYTQEEKALDYRYPDR